MAGSDFNINFTFDNKAHQVHFQRAKPGEGAVNIGGVAYRFAADKASAETMKAVLGSIDLQGLGSFQDLIGRMSKVANMSSVTLQKTEDASLAVLGTKMGNVPALGKAIDSYVSSLADNAHFRGAVLVTRGKDLILREGYGSATAAEKNRPTTTFQIGSLTKQFTAAAILKMIEDSQGKIKLTDKINQYLPAEYQSKNYDNVTLHELLSHTSGLPSYTDDPDYPQKAKNLTIDKILLDAKSNKIAPEAAGKYKYSNTGYLLLGAIIENVSKKPYGQYLEENVLKPAGMKDSGAADASYFARPKQDTAVGYCFDESGETLVEDHSEDLAATCGADGIMYSTLDDLAKWSRVLDGKSGVLSPNSFKQMQTPIDKDYGYGIAVDVDEGEKRVHHTGLVPGYYCDFCKYPDEDVLVVVLGNNGRFPVERVTDGISKILHGKKQDVVGIVPKKFDLSEPLTKGAYQSQNYHVELQFTVKADRLYMGAVGQSGKDECVLLSNGRFYNVGQNLELEIQPNGTIIAYGPGGKVMDTLTPVHFFRP